MEVTYTQKGSNLTAFLIFVSHQYHTNAARSAQDLALLFPVLWQWGCLYFETALFPVCYVNILFKQNNCINLCIHNASYTLNNLKLLDNF